MNPTRFRHLCFVLLLPLLGSCGGGGGSSASSSSTAKPLPTATVINGITVPVEPDATANAATLKGIDANNNGVRDDVERSIAVTYPTQNLELRARAAIEQKLIENNGDASTLKEEGKIAFCNKQKISDEELYSLIYNTPERQAFQAKQPPVKLPDVVCE